MMAAFAFFSRSEFFQKLFKWRFRIITFFCFLVYLPTLFNGYGLDDELVIQNHPLTTLGIKALPEIWKSSYYKDAMGYSYGYRPFVLTSFALEYSMWGNNLFLSHLLNLVLYALLCVLILYWLEMLLIEDYRFIAFAVAALFALYPLHSEVVCSLKNREEILSMIGGIGAAIFLFRKGSWSIVDFILALIFFLLGMLSKNTIFLLPLLLPLISLFTRNPLNLKLLLFGLIAPMPAASLLDVSNSLHILSYALVCQLIVLVIWFLKSEINLPLNLPVRSFLGVGGLSQYPNLSRASLFTFLSLIALFFCLYFKLALWSCILLASLAVWALLCWNNIESAWAVFLVLLYSFIFYYSAILPYLWTFVGDHIIVISFFGLLGSKGRFDVLFGLTFLLAILVSIYTADADGVAVLILLPFLLAYHFRKLPIGSEWLFLLFVLINLIGIKFNGNKILSSALINLPWALFFIRLWYAKRKGDSMPEMGSFLLLMFLSIVLINGVAHDHLGGGLTSEPKNLYDLRQSAGVLNNFKSRDIQNRPLTYIEAPLDWEASLSEVSATSLKTASWYIRKLFIPYPMVCYYGFSEFTASNWSDRDVWIGLSIILIITLVLGILAFRGTTHPFLLWLCLLFLLLPYSNAFTRIPGMVADRYTFLPSLASSALIVALFYASLSWLPSRLKRLPQYFMIGMLLLHAGLSFSRSFEWKDRLTLFRADVQKAPRSVQLNNLLGVQLMLSAMNSQDPRNASELALEAVQSFNRAIAIYPDFFNLHYDKGRAWMFLNEPDSAIAAFVQAKRINSAFPPLNEQLCLAFIAKGFALESLSAEKAREAYNEAIEADSSQADAYNRMAFSLYSTASYDSAKQILRQGLKNCGIKAELWANLGKIHLSMAQPDSAVYCFRQALAEKPGMQEWETLNQEALRRNTQ